MGKARRERERKGFLDEACEGLRPLFGVETEYAVCEDAMDAFCGYLRGRDDLDEIFKDVVMYEDCDHPEYGTPPCDSPARLAREWKKGNERVARACLAGKHFVGRACHQLESESGEETTWGFHENYTFGTQVFHENPLVGRGEDEYSYGADPVAGLMLLSRACWAGAGGLVHNRRSGGALFSMSPRLAVLADGRRKRQTDEDETLSVENKGPRAHVVLAETPMDGNRLGTRIGATWLFLAARMASRNAEEALRRLDDRAGRASRDSRRLLEMALGRECDDARKPQDAEVNSLHDDMRDIAAGGMLADADNIRRMATVQQTLLDETKNFWARRAGRPRWASSCLKAWSAAVARARRGDHSRTDWGIKLAALRKLGLLTKQPGGRFVVPRGKLNRAIEADARFGQLPTGMFEIATGVGRAR